VQKCEKEVLAVCKEAGEQAVFDLGLHRVHPELVQTLGQLKFRSSYAQNLLQHLPPSPPPEYVQLGAPDVIQRLQEPGVATIVEFVDFECPFCRRLHQTMQEVLKDYDGKVRVVRKQHPLAMHSHAADAARAACCADEAGRGDEMADALYHAPPENLTAEGCEKLAASIGLDVAKYRQCFASDDTTRRLAEDAADARAAGLREEAPVFWIGDVRYRGALPADMIRMGIDRALNGR
jgi:protein-disulfide isomerase